MAFVDGVPAVVSSLDGAGNSSGPTARMLSPSALLFLKETVSGLTLDSMTVPLTRSFVAKLRP